MAKDGIGNSSSSSSGDAGSGGVGGGGASSDSTYGNNLSTTPPSSSSSSSATTGPKRSTHRSKPYDANNSFVKKVATKMTDLIPQKSWISKWFNSSQEEAELQTMEAENSEYEVYEEKQTQPPPLKRPCIRMDVTHPPGTFSIKSRKKTGETESSKEHFSNHNETTQDFLEPSVSGLRLPRFVSSTPAFSMDTGKAVDTHSTLNMLMTEQNNNGAANGMDDNSESSESTSGCSSLIPQNNRQEAPSNPNFNSPFGKRRFIDDKLSFTNHLQSPRSLFLDSTARETLSSRQPSFNPLMMNNTLDRSSSLLSPFYPGNTTFGGANAANLYRRSRSVLSEPTQVPKRTSVQVNPSSDSSTTDHTGMSHTARRILEALEQFSSPLTDAKKIPVRNVMGGSSSSGNHTLSPLNRKRSREDETSSSKVGLRHLTRELMVPTVPDILRIRRRQKLQNTTVNARKIMTARNANNPPANQEYHIRTETDVQEPKRNTQLKAKKKMNLEEQETVEAVNLPTIALPISNLPRFDISLPQCTKPATPERYQSPKHQSDKDNSFKFASPIKLSEGAKTLESINNFTFSKPMSPSKASSTLLANEPQELSRTLSVDSNDTMSTSSSFPNFVWTGPSQTHKAKEKSKGKKEESKGPKVAGELKSGSIMDFFAKSSSTSSNLTNVWECNECLIKNNGKELHCMACKSAKPDSSDEIEILECPSDNKDSKINAASREDSKLSKSSTKSLTSLSSSPSIFGKMNSASSPALSTKTSSPFSSNKANVPVEKSKSEMTTTAKSSTATVIFGSSMPASTALPPLSSIKPAKSSWECPCCMVRNVDTVTSCPCCNTAKPGTINISPKRSSSSLVALPTSIPSGFGDKFKKPEGSWSCDTCLIQNKAEANKCAACETPKPNAKGSKEPAPPLCDMGFGDKFKKPEGWWTCDSCMLSNKPDVAKCMVCEAARPGGVKTSPKATKGLNGFQPVTGGFSFVSPSAEKGKESEGDAAKTGGFSFKSSETVTATATFQFGSKPLETKETNGANKPATTTGFTFGVPAKSDAKPGTGGFVFGSSKAATTVNKAEKEKSEAKVPTGGFVFGAQAASLAPASKDSTSDEEAKPATKSVAPGIGNFVFGSPKPIGDLQSKDTPKKAVVKDAKPAEIPKVMPTFSVPTEQQKPAAPTFTFGAPATASSSATSTTTATTSPSLFTFTGQPKASETPASTTALPAFGSVASPKPTFTFGKPAETATTATSASGTTTTQQTEKKVPAMTFGSTVTAGATFGSQSNQTPTLFGNVNTASPAASTLGSSANKPALIFGAQENKSAPAFGEPEAKMPAFGSAAATATAVDSNKPNATFAAASKPTTDAFSVASATPTFGAPAAAASATAAAASSPFGSSSSMFGGVTPSTFGTSATPGIFSTTKASETTPANPGLFTFGQSAQASTTPAATSGFNFSTGSNASAANATDQKGIFSFGASSSSNTQVGNGFNGGSFRSVAGASPASFTFNAPPKLEASPAAATAFGQVAAAAATTPMFNAPSATVVAQPAVPPPAYPGTASPAPAASGFNFGSTNVPNGFSFGSAPTPTPGGFTFNAPSNNPAAPVAFDPNAQPTFNFTAGSGAPTAFNAPPARKIKKAVRRMPRQ